MGAVRVIVAEGESLAVPAGFREALGIKPGDAVLVETHGRELRVVPENAALRRLQQRLSKHTRDGRYVSDELIADRHAEAERGD